MKGHETDLKYLLKVCLHLVLVDDDREEAKYQGSRMLRAKRQTLGISKVIIGNELRRRGVGGGGRLTNFHGIISLVFFFGCPPALW